MASADTDPLLEIWGRTLRRLRQSVNADGERCEPDDECMTQEQFGQELDPPVRQSTVARWEAGAREPRRRYKHQIAVFYGISQDDIFVSSVKSARLPLADPPTRRRRKAVA